MANNLQRKTNRSVLNITQVEKEIRALRAENEYLKAVLENKRYLYNKEKSNLQTQLEDLKNKRDAASEAVQLPSDSQNLTVEIDEATGEVQELTEIGRKLQKQLDEMKELQIENDLLQQKLEEMQNNDTESSSSELIVQHERLSNDVVEMKHRLNELIRERDNARIQFDEAKRKLEEAKQRLD